MKTCFKWLMVITLAGVLASCSTPRKLSYLRDLEYNIPSTALPAPVLMIQPGDVLAISVSSDNPLLAAPFNGLTVSGVNQSGGVHSISYTVDSSGDITFPVLGHLHVAGMDTGKIETMIADQISSLGYIKEPVVSVSLANFNVTVIGSSGNLIIDAKGPSLNLFQVIAQAGGTSPKTNIKDIMVIRTENGERMAYKVDLSKKAVFDSPVYYLRQNDIVYIKPKGTSFSSEGTMVMTFVGTGLSVASIVVNYLLWSSRL